MKQFRIGSAVQVKEDHHYLSVSKGTKGKIVGFCSTSSGVMVQLLIPRIITFQMTELKPAKRTRRAGKE